MSSPNAPLPPQVDGNLDSCWPWVTFLVAEKVTAAFCYAFMIALLTYAMVIMRTRCHLPETPVFIAMFSWMVILSTMQIMLDLVDLSISMRSMKTLFQSHLTSNCDNAAWLPGTVQILRAQWAVLAANILVADGVFVYRCYQIWTRDIKIIIVPASLLIATTITTAVVPTGRLDERVALGFGLATNLVLLTLSVGRILYNSRTMERDFGMSAARNHNKSAMRIVIYGGVLYCATALMVLISRSVGTGSNLAFYISVGAARHVVNIAPILAVLAPIYSEDIPDISTTFVLLIG
ncbi:hypothetical protein GGX14DRAFT_695690 [Mycena pura]|uniref:Transmembrane protein n=1 Tax=Mycena pura TaxID=153505 RepID=A0AAD6VNW5_9AGAR|nr:hypothetical protein GGX14DRAFT_695690 [Mycena pura]